MASFATRDDGVFILKTEWTPSPEETEREFIQLADYYHDVDEPLRALLGIAQADTAQRFKEESSPARVPWAELTQEYLARKDREGFRRNPILVREGELRDRAPLGWTIVGETIVYDPLVLPRIKKGKDAGKNLGLIHQEGSGGGGNAGKGRNTGITNRGKSLPARPFIGLTITAQYEMEYVWEQWVEEGVVWWNDAPPGAKISRTSIFKHKSGREQFRIGGRWGPNV